VGGGFANELLKREEGPWVREEREFDFNVRGHKECG